ncbi:MAG: transglycosylase domain-containing protein, partial [Chitinophagaceae bacterium]|nr:transglycosylase domain-containing protein [Chitinophagaceae bacterium]
MTRSVRLLWKSVFAFLGLVLLLFLATNFGLLGRMPSIEDLQNPSASIASEVYADDGTPMGKFYLEDRSPVAYRDISPFVIKALVATEDERFYSHSGIDGKSLLRAVKGIITFNPAGGASTISQQLALNLFGGQRASNKLSRGIQKIKEWIIAVKLERNFTKDEIITYYLNTVAFGDNVYGIRNAARTFFQKEPDRLELNEAAVLVGMLKANTTYNPRRNPKAALDRRNTVLDQMVRNQYLQPAEAESLKREPIRLNYKKLDANAGIAPYFRENVVKEEVRRLLKDLTKPNGDKYDIYRDGLKIYTTINPRMQLYAEEATARNIAAQQRVFKGFQHIRSGTVFEGREKELERFIKQSDRWRIQREDGMSDEENRASFNKEVPMKIFAWNSKRETDTTLSPLDSIKYLKTLLQSGFMAMEPQTGYVKAWVGGIDYKTFKIDHNNLNIKRQVGSTIKPMLYCQAIEEAGFTPETPLPNVPQNFPGYGMVPATGKGATGGSAPMAIAIAKSLNGSAAYLMKQIGPARFVEFLNRCNVQTEVDAYPSVALGSCDLSLYELMWMYTMFPGRGFNTKPQFISRIEDRNGNILVNVAPQIKEVISEVTAYTMCKMMGGALRYGTATRMNAYGIQAEMGAKTGTTNNNTDAWFMVFSPELLVGTWVGCDENWIHFPSNSAAGYGGSAALPACGMFLQRVYGDRKLGYDPAAKFVKPAVEKNDIIYDYFQNMSGPVSPDAEGEDLGNGAADEYLGDQFGRPDTSGLGQIQAESQLPSEKEKPAVKPKPDTSGRKPDSDPDKTPRAVMPP